MNQFARPFLFFVLFFLLRILLHDCELSLHLIGVRLEAGRGASRCCRYLGCLHGLQVPLARFLADALDFLFLDLLCSLHLFELVLHVQVWTIGKSPTVLDLRHLRDALCFLLQACNWPSRPLLKRTASLFRKQLNFINC